MHYLTINITHPIGFVKDFFPPGCFWKAPFAGMTRRRWVIQVCLYELQDQLDSYLKSLETKHIQIDWES